MTKCFRRSLLQHLRSLHFREYFVCLDPTRRNTKSLRGGMNCDSGVPTTIAGYCLVGECQFGEILSPKFAVASRREGLC